VPARDRQGGRRRRIHVVSDPFAEEAPAGSTVFIGTETNLVLRLAARYAGEKTIIPLLDSRCSNMAKITEEKLAAQLANLENEHPVNVPDDIREPPDSP
jgi:quinolinate synthase